MQQIMSTTTRITTTSTTTNNTVTLKSNKSNVPYRDKRYTNSTYRHVIRTENPFKNDDKKVMQRADLTTVHYCLECLLFLLIVYRTGSQQTIHRRVTGEISKIRPFGSMLLYMCTLFYLFTPLFYSNNFTKQWFWIAKSAWHIMSVRKFYKKIKLLTQVRTAE